MIAALLMYSGTKRREFICEFLLLIKCIFFSKFVERLETELYTLSKNEPTVKEMLHTPKPNRVLLLKKNIALLLGIFFIHQSFLLAFKRSSFRGFKGTVSSVYICPEVALLKRPWWEHAMLNFYTFWFFFIVVRVVLTVAVF
jgi:hypothetical protein